MNELTSDAKRETGQDEQHGPPMPKFLFKLVNPLMKLALNSPFHRRMSDRLMVLSFTGRKTGKRYSTPVGYVWDGNAIYVFTHSPWRFNFQQTAPVSMRIQGRDVAGTGYLVSDPARIKQIVQVLSRANGEEMSRRMGFWVEGLNEASPEELLQSIRGTYFIEIQPENGQ